MYRNLEAQFLGCGPGSWSMSSKCASGNNWYLTLLLDSSAVRRKLIVPYLLTMNKTARYYSRHSRLHLLGRLVLLKNCHPSFACIFQALFWIRSGSYECVTIVKYKTHFCKENAHYKKLQLIFNSNTTPSAPPLRVNLNYSALEQIQYVIWTKL